jgi:hypothetical protein
MKSAEDRRAVWRQTLATLARAAEGPGPLEGLHPDAMNAAVRVALADGLVDDTDWLAEPAAGAALYELAAAVPIGVEQRELGRRVLARLLQGSAETFTAIATRMALGTGKGLSTPHVRARIALVIELPLALGVADGPLCLAFVARRQLARELIVQPSTASLPARRSAARIFERAAREAARRAQQGDDHAMRAFSVEGVQQAFDRLLADREPLVWRHAAAARGMLMPWIKSMQKAVHDGIDPKLTPTEWRRAATSITALMSVEPEEAKKLVKQWMSDSGPLKKDPGGASALVWGLARAAESEPEAAAALLEQLADRMPLAIAEAAVDLGADFGTAGPFDEALGKVMEALRDTNSQKGDDEGAVAMQREILRELERLPRARASKSDAEPREDDPLDVQVAHALATFATEGARPAYARATAAFDSLHGLLDALEAVSGGESPMARRTSLMVLRQIDLSLLERSTLLDLLHLAPTPEAAKTHEEAAATARERVAGWVLARFRESEDEDKKAGPIRDATMRLRRLRALLHLVDSDLGDDDPARAGHLRKRWSRIASALLRRMEGGLPPILRRANAATLSRTLDALVRAEAIDPADALLAIVRRVGDPAELRVLAEASMDPSLRHALSRYAELAAAVAQPKSDAPPASIGAPMKPLASEIAALDAWTLDGLLDPSNRAEALRTVVVRLSQAVAAIARSGSLEQLCSAGGTDADVVAAFEGAVTSLVALSTGARARLEVDGSAAGGTSRTRTVDGSAAGGTSRTRTVDGSAAGGTSRTRTVDGSAAGGTSRAPGDGSAEGVSETSLAVDVSRVLSGAQPALDAAVVEAVRQAAHEIPPALESVVVRALDVLSMLQAHEVGRHAGAVRITEQLPAWLPARRTLGGFYVVRPLASGGGGTVLVAVRIEDRQDEAAERFALKVPSYDASAARSVSEAEFFQMFRAEASALIALPAHPNLARFVTFDTGSRPKPILVMELVEGQNLDHEIASRALDTKRAFKLLDDVLAGLEAMHGVDVGHLDLKPSNVVLRQGVDAVLVDFGLSGRRIRPGCATGPYGAPEVWGADVTTTATPTRADMYAFGCVAYEALTGDVLFQADNELQQIALHLAHDGFPDKLRKLAAKPTLQPLAETLFSTLRRDPLKRSSVPQVRGELRRLAGELAGARWPL